MQAGKAMCKEIYQSRLEAPWEKLISSDEVGALSVQAHVICRIACLADAPPTRSCNHNLP